MMRAVVITAYGGPEVLKVAQIAIPTIAPDQVLIAVEAVGVNPVETYIRAGSYASAPKPPFTPGNDCSGVVEAVGAEVTGLNVGDRVYTKGSVSGTYAEKCVCNASAVHSLPSRVSFSQGAAIGIPYSTAYYALFCSGEAQAAQTVLIHGASGGVGIAAVQLARAHGCTVIGSAGTERGLQLVKEQGAHRVVNHCQSGYLESVGKVDLIIENLANVNLANDLTLLNKRGTVVVVGNRGEITINPRLLMMNNASIKGILGPNATPEESARAFAGIYAGLESGSLNPVVDTEYALEDASQAHIDILEKRHYGKLVLKVK